MAEQIMVNVADCHALRRNPQVLTPHTMEALKASIERDGFLAPVLLRARAEGGGYEVVSGNHRVMAARELGMTEVPALVVDLDDRQMLRVAINLNTVHGDPLPSLLVPMLSDIDDDLLASIHFDSDLLARCIEMDAHLQERLAEMSRPDHLDITPSSSEIAQCVCPTCGKRHIRTGAEGASDDGTGSVADAV